MGHKVGTMACHTSVSGTNIDIERGESTPLLKKHYDYKPTLGKQAWDPKCVILSCFLIIGSFIGLYLLIEQGIVHFILHLCCLLYNLLTFQNKPLSLMCHSLWLNGQYLTLRVPHHCYSGPVKPQLRWTMPVESLFLTLVSRSASQSKCVQRSSRVL